MPCQGESSRSGWVPATWPGEHLGGSKGRQQVEHRRSLRTAAASMRLSQQRRRERTTERMMCVERRTYVFRPPP